MGKRISTALASSMLVAVGAAAGCSDSPAGKSYYERNIDPILRNSCAGSTSGCHVANTDDPYSFAGGNFDVSTFENVQKRRDLLEPFGAYTTPVLLIKSVAPKSLFVGYNTGLKTIDVLHAGGPIFEPGSPAYLTLQSWLDNGATENGLAPPSPPKTGGGECSTVVPPGFAAATYLSNPNFAKFKSDVMPILKDCNSGNCHGAPQSDLYITCGDDDTQLAYNFSLAWSFVATPVDDSQILKVPLAVADGGVPHSGGDRFDKKSDPKYQTLRAWSEAVGRLEFGENDPAKKFFADNVQPMLLQRGCAFQACHSPQAGNDFKLRSGTVGFFSSVGLERNYDLLRNEFMAVEFPDARRGRAISKSVLSGIAHRGGAVLETPGTGLATPAGCPNVYVPATATAFCTIQEWVNIERQALLTAGQVSSMNAGDTLPIVYVERATTHVASRLEFDTYQPDSDLRVAIATLDANQHIASVAGSQSLLGNCGVTLANVDVQAPDIRNDGTTVVFAMRTNAAAPLTIWTVGVDGNNCLQVTTAAPDQNGIKLHDFDPAWSPDGQFIVFASTRGKAGVGPGRSRKYFRPQSDLWRMQYNGAAPAGAAQQMTFLSNSEISPQFMREGRVTMSTEKVSSAFGAAGFYQVSGRRLNWDLTDYHPLVGQRAQSGFADGLDAAALKPSIGYQMVNDIREGADGNFMIILSEDGAKAGAGTLATFNRSIGPMELTRPTDGTGYLPSLRIIDPAATGRLTGTNGAYRAPVSMPSGEMMVAYAPASSLAATSFDWDIIAINPATGAKQTLIGGAGAQLDAVLGYKSPARDLYLNRRQLVFGGAYDATRGTRAIVHIPDAPMLFSLLSSNLRRGRPVDGFRNATQLAIFSEGVANAMTLSGNGPGGIFESRTLLGRAKLASDGSVKLDVPSGVGVVLELQDDAGNTITNMGEEHQFGAGEGISLGIRQPLFDAVCGGCHGSVSGNELDVHVTPDALTGASQSRSAAAAAFQISP
ncbi:MAG: PD40 domain-containing protein [Kofleriaceae bacterium]|nr:PD40 domain-containing protein [Kofleriaceae bacterium]